jgi:uncharacterized repeat protein (TIGR04076 family)
MKQVKAICTSCNIETLDVTCDNESFNAKETLPEGLCFLAFHQIFPYIRTLTSGGWFNWVGHDEHVIVKCPAVDGIAVHVKAPNKNEPEILESQVIEKQGPCFRGHKMHDRFRFDVSKKNLERLEVLFDLFPDLMNSTFSRKATGTMQARFSDEKVRSVDYTVSFTKAVNEID